ncbi:MAG: peptidoglycan DD-metalloendopeptidase family protein [Pseudomonadota bacterium]
MRRLAGALLIATLALVGAARAQSPAEQMDQTRTQLEAASTALKKASGGRARLAALGKAVAAHEHALSTYREVLRRMRGREGRMKADLAKDSTRLETLVGAMQSLSQAPRSAIMMFPGGPVAAMRGAGMMSEISPELATAAARLRGRLDKIQQSRAAQEAARVEIRGTLATLQALRNQTSEALSTRRGRKLPSRADLKAQAEVAAQTATNLGELSSALRASEAGDPHALVSFTEARGLISPPVRGQVIAWFGDKDPQGRKGFGITMNAPAYAEVSAPWDGTIRYAGPLIDYGEVVILEPETGTLMVLAGLARTERVAGEIVLAGERLGDLGGPIPSSDEFLLEETTDRDEIGNRKLYIELRRGDEAVDPAVWFDLTEREAGR